MGVLGFGVGEHAAKIILHDGPMGLRSGYMTGKGRSWGFTAAYIIVVTRSYQPGTKVQAGIADNLMVNISRPFNNL